VDNAMVAIDGHVDITVRRDSKLAELIARINDDRPLGEDASTRIVLHDAVISVDRDCSGARVLLCSRYGHENEQGYTDKTGETR
jgi:hypothetical protein